jgi:hypothetical protein
MALAEAVEGLAGERDSKGGSTLMGRFASVA